MLVNRYILKSVITGEVIIGTREELGAKGFDGDHVYDAMHRKYLLSQEWDCQLYDKIQKPKKQEKKDNKKLSLDEINRMARAAGMNYGQYVAMHNL